MPKDQAGHIKRKQYFVQKDFQFKFILKFCMVLIVGIIISTGLVLLFSENTLTSSFEQSRLVIKNTASAILPSVFLSHLIAFVLISLLAIVVTLLVSHKLAGPLFRFEKELKEMGSGDLSKEVKIREKDQFKAVANSLNQMRVNLQKKVVDIKKEVEQIVASTSDQEIPPDLVKRLDHLNRMIRNNFKV
ncbi:MAG: methyl-accepting chemotaxis protein [Desulfobacterales bacterium]